MVKMQRSKCSMIGCLNDDVQSVLCITQHKRFHAFPSSFNLCLYWVQNCGRRELFEEFVFAGSEPFKNRHVCSDHFDNKDFTDPRDKLSRLLPTAVPNLNQFILEVEVNIENSDMDITNGFTHRHVSYWDILHRLEQDEIENNSCSDSVENLVTSDDERSHEKPKDVPRSKKDGKTEQKTSNQCKKRKKMCAKLSTTSNAVRIRLKKLRETKEEKEARLKKDALRVAKRRRKETPEQREARLERDRLRARRRRQLENKQQTERRRSKDAERAAKRRKNFSAEQRSQVKKKDNERKEKHRRNETALERELRQKRDKARKGKRQLGEKPKFAVPIKLRRTETGPLKTSLTPLQSTAAECNDSTSKVGFDKLLQVVEIVHNKMTVVRERRKCTLKKIYYSDSDVCYVGRQSPVQCVDLSKDSDADVLS